MKLPEREKTEMMLGLTEHMEHYLETLPEEHKVGLLPDDTTTLMANAALNVLLTINSTNVYFEENPS